MAAPYQCRLKLDQFLKWHALAASGGEAKQRILRGDVCVNGVIETRRGRQLALGDAVSLDGRELLVTPLARQEADRRPPEARPDRPAAEPSSVAD